MAMAAGTRPMTPEQRAAARARCEAATPGPWEWVSWRDDYYYRLESDHGMVGERAPRRRCHEHLEQVADGYQTDECRNQHLDRPKAATLQQRRHSELFVVAAPLPLGRVVVGQEDVVHVDEHPARQAGKDAVEEEIDVGAGHQDVAGVDEQDVAARKR